MHRGFSIKNIKTFIELFQGINESKKIIEEYKPDLVIGTGGYVTAPVMIAATKKKIPTMIHESNALPGKATLWLSKKIDLIALGFEAARDKLPNAKKVVVTGNPTKMNGKLNKVETRQKLGINKPLILVYGGSQGAKRINEVMVNLINKNSFKDYEIIFATGSKNYDEIISKVNLKSENIKIEKYIYNMEEMMVASDLLICRSGAMTVTEIGVVGVPSILIPFPHAAENHQYYNAKTLEDRGASVVILEQDLTGDELLNNISKIMCDDELRKNMATNAKVGDDKALEKINEAITSIKFGNIG